MILLYGGIIVKMHRVYNCVNLEFYWILNDFTFQSHAVGEVGQGL